MSRKRFKEFSVSNMKKTGFYGYVYGFSVNYDDTVNDDIRYSQIFEEKEWYVSGGRIR